MRKHAAVAVAVLLSSALISSKAQAQEETFCDSYARYLHDYCGLNWQNAAYSSVESCWEEQFSSACPEQYSTPGLGTRDYNFYEFPVCKWSGPVGTMYGVCYYG